MWISLGVSHSLLLSGLGVDIMVTDITLIIILVEVTISVQRSLPRFTALLSAVFCDTEVLRLSTRT